MNPGEMFKRVMGRPRKYDSVESMQEAIQNYFDSVKQEDLTITGLALHLGFTSRKDLINYEGYSEEFHHTIKKAKLIVENGYEGDLKKHGRPGTIFALKNFDWIDKREVENTGTPFVGMINPKDLENESNEYTGTDKLSRETDGSLDSDVQT